MLPDRCKNHWLTFNLFVITAITIFFNSQDKFIHKNLDRTEVVTQTRIGSITSRSQFLKFPKQKFHYTYQTHAVKALLIYNTSHNNIFIGWLNLSTLLLHLYMPTQRHDYTAISNKIMFKMLQTIYAHYFISPHWHVDRKQKL